MGLEKQLLQRCRAKRGMFGIQHGAALSREIASQCYWNRPVPPQPLSQVGLTHPLWIHGKIGEAETNSKISAANSSCTTVRFPVASENPKIARLATLLVLNGSVATLSVLSARCLQRSATSPGLGTALRVHDAPLTVGSLKTSDS